MVPYKTTLSSFKCWQPIQIFINHCVGQIKHVWGLNLAQRPPLFNLCSRRRTEFQLVWNESFCGTNRLGFWVSTLPCRVTPPLYSCKSETGLEPCSWKEKKHRRRSSMVGYGGGGSLQPGCHPGEERWLQTDATWWGHQGAMGNTRSIKWLCTQKTQEPLAEKQKTKTKQTNKKNPIWIKKNWWATSILGYKINMQKPILYFFLFWQ